MNNSNNYPLQPPHINSDTENDSCASKADSVPGSEYGSATGCVKDTKFPAGYVEEEELLSRLGTRSGGYTANELNTLYWQIEGDGNSFQPRHVMVRGTYIGSHEPFRTFKQEFDDLGAKVLYRTKGKRIGKVIGDGLVKELEKFYPLSFNKTTNKKNTLNKSTDNNSSRRNTTGEITYNTPLVQKRVSSTTISDITNIQEKFKSPSYRNGALILGVNGDPNYSPTFLNMIGWSNSTPGNVTSTGILVNSAYNIDNDTNVSREYQRSKYLEKRKTLSEFINEYRKSNDDSLFEKYGCGVIKAHDSTLNEYDSIQKIDIGLTEQSTGKED